MYSEVTDLNGPCEVSEFHFTFSKCWLHSALISSCQNTACCHYSASLASAVFKLKASEATAVSVSVSVACLPPFPLHSYSHNTSLTHCAELQSGGSLVKMVQLSTAVDFWKGSLCQCIWTQSCGQWCEDVLLTVAKHSQQRNPPHPLLLSMCLSTSKIIGR